MILLPIAGLAAGALIGRRLAFALTGALALVGFGLVAATTDEISGWGDLFVWGDTAIALIATWVGIKARRAWAARRTA